MDKVYVDYLQEPYLQERWHQLMPLTNPLSKHYFDKLIAAYSELHRFYHTTQHLRHLIGLLR